MQQPGFVLFRAEELPARIGLSGALLYFATTTLAETIFFRGVLLGSLVVVSRWGVLAGSPDLIGGGDLGIEARFFVYMYFLISFYFVLTRDMYFLL